MQNSNQPTYKAIKDSARQQGVTVSKDSRGWYNIYYVGQNPKSGRYCYNLADAPELVALLVSRKR